MPDFPLSILMILASALFACFAYTRLSLIWEPKIPKPLFFTLIAIVYGALGFVSVYYFKCRYMLVVLEIVNLIIVKLVFNTGLLMTLFCANTYVYIYALSKIVVSSLADMILGYHIHTFGEIAKTDELCMVLIFTYILSAVLMYLFTTCASRPNVQEQYKNEAPGLMATVKRFTIMLIAFNIIETSSEPFSMNDRTMAFYHLALSLFLGICFFIMFVYFSAVDRFNENTEESERVLRERRFAYYNVQAKYLDEFRQFRHDYKNRLAGLKALLDSGEAERAKEYLSDVTEKFDVMREHTKTYSNNTLIDSVMQNLSARCTSAGVKFDASVIVGNEIPLSDMDICTVFYNIADNAYEAASKDYEGEKFVNFITSRRAKWLIITAENSFDGVLIKSKKNEIETSKNDDISHGIGLKNIKRIVESVPGATVKIEPNLEEKIFRISLIFPRENNEQAE